MFRTAENISGFPHWIDPKPLGSTKSRCMSMMMSAVVAGGNVNVYGRALGRDILVEGAILKASDRGRTDGGMEVL